ncbi:type II restriction endonuclease [Bradyrhizobium yuanmingense]|uniref:type II restriction endonuclease n=1 Tax=Bradyrhizobium yuanmingense TaxID=108015 RepID=UPI0023B95934|nr:type II restriction endonuclease [Bradyrhizobium yuanmingense]MDF0498461.1 type II restriction endonuclease [Bradyrhizobium yuanmingense]
MNKQVEFVSSQPGADADLITAVFQKASRLLVKKLSNNDRDWARDPNKHQYGVYIPHKQRDGGFFPPMTIKPREDPDADEIREAWFKTVWPQTGKDKKSRLVHYTSKGQETHLTRVPKEVFADLLPASLLLIGRLGDGRTYECLTVDSGSEEAHFLAQLLGLHADFEIAEFDPAAVRAHEREAVLDFAGEVIAAWQSGQIEEFANKNALMPDTAELARLAREAYLNQNSLEKLNPFVLAAPGDALREISRTIEFDLFRDFQRKERSVELVRLVLGDAPRAFNISEVIRRLIDEEPAIDALMLSASQQRKSRAGYSYEHHIEAMLLGGSIPFEKQVIIEAKKRPDFMLPSRQFVDSGEVNAATGLILSAKTTLRERWKQVLLEMGERRLFLMTVDENIPRNAIEDMASKNIGLVIPESLMKSEETEYSGHSNVFSFRDFCVQHIQPHLAIWPPHSPISSPKRGRK